MFKFYSIFTFYLTISEFVNSVLLSLLDNYIFEGISIISIIIYLASRQTLKGALYTTAKLVGIGAGSTIIYNSWFKRSSSESNEDNKKDKDNKNNKDNKNKQISNNQVTNGK